MAQVYRAPMRSRRDDIDPQAALDRALRRGLVGFGDAEAGERLARRIDRFAAAPEGSFVWTRDGDGLFWLGRIEGAYFRDDDADAVAVDLVHVRPCRWLPSPVTESVVPAAVLATFGRGGRNFQRTHAADVGPQTERLWATRATDLPS
ncbi:GAF domain-containing protein [Mycolicibacterium flavescens]|uniref:GAF domain-containing protein n=1 Tax=Mycolicibacterium flavescens TaxID=1776 RepID=A0A1E3RD45_MYCFV|nr:hypothetical protein [Mycolicibacterium flavescens]MCV7278404.1 GAF domain-containing protein [Mycolicibacterium flavescens]ODQ87806.1 hypothetical protein BHQ18_22395 [Mycolicibacterium flavescens]